ncbi:hypothetical protein HWV62_29875 [Athelia sp. TMB]|nr:hypothetical protein HWV62_29875 [Athelia sp. TMB]
MTCLSKCCPSSRTRLKLLTNLLLQFSFTASATQIDPRAKNYSAGVQSPLVDEVSADGVSTARLTSRPVSHSRVPTKEEIASSPSSYDAQMGGLTEIKYRTKGKGPDEPEPGRHFNLYLTGLGVGRTPSSPPYGHLVDHSTRIGKGGTLPEDAGHTRKLQLYGQNGTPNLPEVD